LKKFLDLRDTIGRKEDESIRFVLNDEEALKLAK
jgi:hypothetical protein